MLGPMIHSFSIPVFTERRTNNACAGCRLQRQRCVGMQPCARCLRVGRTCVPQVHAPRKRRASRRAVVAGEAVEAGGEVVEAELTVERPLPFRRGNVDLITSAQPPWLGKIRHAWAITIVKQLWNTGYNCDNLVKLLNSVHPSNSSSMSDLMAGVVRCTPLLRPATATATINPALWENDNTMSFRQIVYDTSSNTWGATPTHIILNRTFAGNCGYHMEELLARFAAHDLPLDISPLDVLPTVLTSLVNRFCQDGEGASGERTYMLRLSPGRRRPYLAFVMTHKEYNLEGRLSKVL